MPYVRRQLARWRHRLRRLAKVLPAVAGDLARNELNLHAAGLVYTTLLSLVPLLAFSFALLKGLGVHNQVEPMLQSYLLPMGAYGEELSTRIVGFIDNMQVGVLGSLGLAMLVFTAIQLVHRVEMAFNRVWRVEHSRSLSRRLSDYVSTLIVGPVLVFSALGLTAAAVESSVFQDVSGLSVIGPLVDAVARLVPYFMVMAAFTFVYVFIPNTRVRPGAAVVGAILAGFLWASLGWGFAEFVAGADQYTAIYSSFAILILFMLWLYLSWLVLLVGADIAYHWQNPQAADADVQYRVAPRDLALLILCRLAQAYRSGSGPMSSGAIAAAVQQTPARIEPLLHQLGESDWVVHTDAPRKGYLLACPASAIALDDVLIWLDGIGGPSHHAGLQSLRQEWREALQARFHGRSLADVCGPAER